MRRAANGNILAGTSRSGFVPARLGLGLGLYGRRGGAALPVMNFNPVTDVPGLVAWYDPTDAATVTLAGSNISQINDKSANGYHLVQAMGANQPPYELSVFNGKNAVRFNGAQYLWKQSLTLNNGAYTVITAFTMDNAGGGSSRVLSLANSGIDAGTIARYIPTLRFTATQIRAYAGTNLQVLHTYTPGVYTLHSSARNASTLYGWIYGGSGATFALADAMLTMHAIIVGSDLVSGVPSGGQYLNGYWFGSLIYNGVLTDADRQKAEGWMAWNVKAATYLNPAHLYRFVPPASGGVVSPPANSVLPAITPTTPLNLGTVLSVSNGTWSNSPSSYSYQWKRDGANIGGATANSYTIVALDHGTMISCTVTATNSGGSGNADASAVGPVFSAVPVNTVAPAISSSTPFTEVNAVLTAANGTWSNTPSSYAYQWLRDGADISGATGSTYTLVTADVGASITCRVTASNVNGAGTPAVSNALSPVLSRRMIPTDLTGLVAWYDPNDPAGLVQSGGFASQLSDLSGNGRHFLQATGANQPSVVTINGKTALNSNGSAQFMATASFTGLPNASGIVFAAVLAIANAGVSLGRWLGGSNSNSDAVAGGLRFSRNGTNAQVQIYAGTGTSTPITFSAAYGGQNILIGQRNNTTLLEATRNGAAVTTGLADASSLNFTRFALFVNLASSNGLGTTYGAGTMGPMAFYNTVLSLSDRQKLEGILAWLAALQASLDPAHPYLTNPPRI